MQTIMALDPSFTHTGVAILKDGKLIHVECIITKPISGYKITDSNIQRGVIISDTLNRIINEYNVSTIFFEMPTGSQSAKASRGLAHVVGIVQGIISSYKMKWNYCLPMAVKKAYGQTKEKVMQRVKAQYPGFEFPKQKGRFEHIADAIAVYNILK
jgi:Holliday junction resolvasome RuvABC endonuclease subunit